MNRLRKLGINVANAGPTVILVALALSFSWFGFGAARVLAGQSAFHFTLAMIVAIASCGAAFLTLRQRGPSAPNRHAVADISARITIHKNQSDMDAIPLPVLIVDASGQILASNKSAVVEFGHVEQGSLLLLRFRTPEMREGFLSSMERLEPVHFEMHEKVPMERWTRVDICPVEDTSVAIAKCLILFRDISESRRLDRMRADFVANASHELRTPLTSITGFIETLRGPARNDEAARERFLGIMQEQSGRMSRLIDDLLSLSRLETRSLNDDAVPLDLVALTNEAIDSMQPLASDGGVEIVRQYSEGQSIIRGMRDEIIQVVENLVENACKYGKSGGKVHVDIRKKKTGGLSEVVLSVRDFGPGIAAEHLPRLTERFYRAPPIGASIQKGTGLGLAIVKHIVTRHRGRLSINSHPGKGSTFVIYFPEHTDTIV